MLPRTRPQVQIIPRCSRLTRQRPSGSSPTARATSRRACRRRSSSSRTPRARASPIPTGARYIDFAGGIGCQNTGHRHAAIVEAIKEQADRYLHQCFMIGVYEPYVEVCRRLAELSPCGGGEQRSILVNSGAEAVENAVKIARWATGRPAVDRLRQRLPRADAARDDDDEQGEAVQGGLRPVRAGGLPRAGAVPVPRDLLRRLDRCARAPLQGRRRPVDGRLCRPRAGAGRGRVPRDAAGLPREAAGALPHARDPVGERRGAVRRRAHRDDVGDRAVRRAPSPT